MPKPKELVITAFFPLFPRLKQLQAVQAVFCGGLVLWESSETNSSL